MNTYNAYYKGKKIEVEAESSYAAQKKAATQLRARKSFDVTIMLAQVDGKDYVHSTAGI